MATEHRPVALPAAQPQPAVTQTTPAPTVKPPTGATKWAKVYLDDRGVPQSGDVWVPVDVNDRRTGHVRHVCREKVRVVTQTSGQPEVTTVEDCPQVAWLLPGSKPRYCPDHGKKPLTAEQPSVLANLLPYLRTVVGELGEPARPWLVLAANVAAGAALEFAEVDPGNVLPTIPGVAVVGYVVAKRTLRKRAIKRNRLERGEKTGRRARRIVRQSQAAGLAAGASALWWTTAAGVDPQSWQSLAAWAAMLAGWGAASYPWWKGAERRRTRTQPAVALPVPEQVLALPDPVQVRAVATWATRIGCGSGPLAHTDLVEFKRLPACDAGDPDRRRLPNWSAKVVAKDPGSINMREQRPNLLGRIAAAYGCTYGDVSFVADESDLSVATVRVQPDNVLAEVRMWQGYDAANDWTRGTSRVGRFDDGADVLYRWWTKTGAVHDLISGCTGSGKSELVAQLLLNSLHSHGLVLDWVGDPQGGQSFGQLKDEVDWFARDVTEIRLMLLAAVKEMYRRNDELSAANVKTWQPTLDMPLLAVTLDEIQSYIQDPVILDLVTRLVGQGRKCGIKMRLITQIPAAYNLGDSTYIKEQLKAGQTFIFRAADDIAARSAMDGDCPVNPMDLPRRWGAGTCAPDETTAGLLFVQGIHGRDVFGRADFTGEDMGPWLADAAGGPSRTPGSFSEAAELESGVLWGDRKARARKALMSGRSDTDLLPGGKAVELIAAASADAPPPVEATAAKEKASPEAVRARDVVLSAAKGARDGNGLVTKARVVQATPAVAEKTRDKAFTDLVADGALRRIKNGLYEVAA